MSVVDAIATILIPTNLIWFVGANILGIFFGSLPGIGASLTMALLIPITFYLPTVTGLIVLVSAWGGAMYGGSVSSILINTPGTGGNVATVFDGFPMARDGKAKVALGLSVTSSMIGGLIGVAVLILFSPILASFAMEFGPSQYFLLTMFGLAIISTTVRESALKGLISAGVGLMIGFIGYDIISGQLRYDFGTIYLQDGISFLTVTIGMYAVAQILDITQEEGSIAKAGRLEGSILEGILLTLKHWKTIIKSAAIGIVFGFAPGLGTSASALVAYSEAVSSSKTPERFGKGEPEGLIAAETANNAVQGGALIPTLTLGIPGNSDSAIFLAGLMMYGITPGRDLFVNNPDLVVILFVALVLTQITFMISGISLTPLFSKITIIPVNLLMPIIWLVAATGAFAIHNEIIDVYVIIILGLLGYSMRKLKYPVVPVLLGVILGPIAERNYLRALMISDGSHKIFMTGYLNLILLSLIIFALALPLIKKLIKLNRGQYNSNGSYC